MMKFRKKPIVVEAMQFGPVGAGARIIEWLHKEGVRVYLTSIGIEIPTLEGRMIAKRGDWVIKGVYGEFYPCNEKIFSMTYDPEIQE